MAAGGTIFGGAGGGGSGTFSYSQQAGAKTYSPGGSPKHRVSTSDPNGYNVKDIGDEEHMFAHHAPRKRPFPLDTVTDYLAVAYLNLCSVEIQLKTADKHNSLIADNSEKKALLQHLRKKAKSIKMMLKNMSGDLDKLSFS